MFLGVYCSPALWAKFSLFDLGQSQSSEDIKTGCSLSSSSAELRLVATHSGLVPGKLQLFRKSDPKCLSFDTLYFIQPSWDNSVVTEDRIVMCWNVVMAVTVCADHLSNVLTIRGGWGHFILPSDWPTAHSVVLLLVRGSLWGHTWTRGTGHVAWCSQQPGMLSVHRHLHLQQSMMTFSKHWQHCKHRHRASCVSDTGSRVH